MSNQTFPVLNAIFETNQEKNFTFFNFHVFQLSVLSVTVWNSIVHISMNKDVLFEKHGSIIEESFS